MAQALETAHARRSMRRHEEPGEPVDLEWARRWPMEHIWRVRRVA